MIYNPVGLLDGTGAKLAIESGTAQPLAGGSVAFTHCEVLDLNADRLDSVIFAVNRNSSGFDIDDFSTSSLRVSQFIQAVDHGRY